MKSFSFSSIAVCLFVMVTLSSAFSATEKYGVITKDERWSIEGSPYLIIDDLLISNSATLTIAPGTKIIVSAKPSKFDSRIKQYDHLDSFSVSIRVDGSLICAGRFENRISFTGEHNQNAECSWYGLALDSAQDVEIAFTDISGSCNGLIVRKGSPLVRNCIFEYNNIGVTCLAGCRARIYNSIISNNTTAGIRVDKANPTISNSLIIYNRNYGVWCDGVSAMTFENNNLFGNGDGNIQGCNPEYGILIGRGKKSDSSDIGFNLYKDPVFAGTQAESLSVEKDITIPTDKSRMKDTTVAKGLHASLSDSAAVKVTRSASAKRYVLSKYSPCINAGRKEKQFNDLDGTRNDIGIWGGPEFYDASK